MQTLRHFIRRDAPPPPPNGERVLLSLPDQDQLLAMCHLPVGPPRGCLIAVHGLIGCMDAPHVLWLTQHALKAGFAILRINMRGAGPARHLARRSYHAGAGGDLVPFIEWAEARFDGMPIFMLGHSLGGTAALNMALDFPISSARLCGLITVGAPLDMTATAQQFNARRNWIYQRYMLAGMKALVAETPAIEAVPLARAMQAASVYEFDDRFTAPMANYDGVDDYYARTSVHHRLNQIGIPSLIIQSSNDPWIPTAPALAQPTDSLPQIVITKGGGHVGFHDSTKNWYIRASLAWMHHQAGLMT